MNRQPMAVWTSFLGVSAKPNQTAIAALVKATRLSVGYKVFGRKTLQFNHVAQSTLDVLPRWMRPTIPHFREMRLRPS